MKLIGRARACRGGQRRARTTPTRRFPGVTEATESISPRNLCVLLKDGEDSMKPKALRILRAHAKRAPQYVIEQAGALRWLGEEVCAAPGLSAAVAMGGSLASSEPEPMGVE